MGLYWHCVAGSSGLGSDPSPAPSLPPHRLPRDFSLWKPRSGFPHEVWNFPLVLTEFHIVDFGLCPIVKVT